MQDVKKLVRFQASLLAESRTPHIVVELDDGTVLSLTATFDQIEDMADSLDEILDAVPTATVQDPDQPAPRA